jgi:hypothetical protein
MDSKATRRFTLLDALVLATATAAGLATIWFEVTSLSVYGFDKPRDGWSPRSLAVFGGRALVSSQLLLAPWTLALLALHLRRPRPPLRRLALRPGAVACLAAAAGMAFGALQLLGRIISLRAIEGRPLRETGPLAISTPFDFLRLLYFFLDSEAIACGILAAWTLLALGRRGRPDRSWLDRSGCALGLLWLAAALGGWYLDEVEGFVQVNTPTTSSSPVEPSILPMPPRDAPEGGR